MTMNDTSAKNVVCAWAGDFASEDDYRHYMEILYEDDDACSQFGIHTGLEWYDEDFVEGWWVKGFSEEQLEVYIRGLLHSEFFFDELKDAIARQNANTFVFMFGERGQYPTNEDLFAYDGRCSEEAKVVHIYKKIYDAP